jgi:putative sugar O-methyltransferase
VRFTTDDNPAAITWKQRQLYRLYVCFVWTIMLKYDRHNLRRRVQEPECGNPFRIKFGWRLLSQDLATSIIECNVMAGLVLPPKPRIAEVGAGYGRVAYTYVNTLPGQYFIFDIPPALAVAQWYLGQTLGSQRVFRFRHFDRLEEVSTEMDQASVVLLTPNQMANFPDQHFDICLGISTFPEMTQAQVDFYLSKFQSLSRGHIFIKQYKAWQNPVDGTDLTADSYHLDPDWRVTLDRTDPVIPTFFNRVWSKASRLPPA